MDYKKRIADDLLALKMESFGAALIVGPKGCGKTTTAKQKAKSVVEVGTSNGYSGIWLGKALKKTGGRLTTIEFYDKRLDVAKENFEKCGVADIIETKRGDAATILEYLPEDFKIDFAFVDANKSQYIKFFEFIKPHLNVGGYIACDNVISHAAKVQTFLEAIDADPDFENVVLPLPAGLSLGKRIR